MVRLSQSHRATQDLDEVVEPSSPTAIVLIAGPGADQAAIRTTSVRTHAGQARQRRLHAFLLLDQRGPVAVADARRKAPHDLAPLTGDAWRID